MPDQLENLVLIVDDEPMILELLQAALEEGGFNVVTAASDKAAIAILERDRARDLVGLITDIRLGCPQSGWDLAHRARELNPGLPIIYVSGDSGHEWSANGVPQSTMIGKPFAPAQVMVALAELINKS